MDDPSTSGVTEGFGLIFYREASLWDNARWYDPSLGRFAQADSIIPQSQGVQAFDRYAYVNNNPVNYTDPTGHFTCSNNPDSDDYCPGNNSPISMDNDSGGNEGGGGDNPQPESNEDNYDILSDIIQGNTPSNQEFCEFLLSGAPTACNPEVWETVSNGITFDPTKFDGIEFFMDVTGIGIGIGIGIDIATWLSLPVPPLAKQFAKAGVWLDVVAVSWEVSKAVEGNVSIEGMSTDVILDVIKSSGPMATIKGFAGVPVFGSFFHATSIALNFGSTITIDYP